MTPTEERASDRLYIMSCLFCKIAKKEAPSEIVYEDEEIIAFKDIFPLAPVHVLIIPKKHIATINQIKKRDIELIGKLIFVAKNLAKKFRIAKKGYKLLFRVGSHGGQVVEHIHLHLIGGTRLSEDIHPI